MPKEKLTVLFQIMYGCFVGFFLMITSGLSQKAQADFINGQQLQLYCASQNPEDEAICIVYITGAVDAFTTVDLIAEKTNGAARIFCLPDGVQPDELKTVTIQWLKRDGTNLDFAATLLVWGAMKDAYSCN